jgi:hypothetical protein
MEYITAFAITGPLDDIDALAADIRIAVPHAELDNKRAHPGLLRVREHSFEPPKLAKHVGQWAVRYPKLNIYCRTLVDASQVHEALFMCGGIAAGQLIEFVIKKRDGTAVEGALEAVYSNQLGDLAGMAQVAEYVRDLDRRYPWPTVGALMGNALSARAKRRASIREEKSVP